MCVPPFLKSYLPPYDCNKYHYDDGIAWHWQSSMSRIAPIRAAAAAAVVVADLLLLQLRSHGKTATVLAAGQIRQKSNTAGKNPTVEWKLYALSVLFIRDGMIAIMHVTWVSLALYVRGKSRITIFLPYHDPPLA